MVWNWACVVERLESHVDIEASSRSCGAIRRTRAIKSAAQLLRLLLAYVLGGMSFRGTAAWADAAGHACLSDVAILKRARRCGPWLRQMVETLAALQCPAAAVGDTRRILALDATTVCSPGDKRDYAVLHTAYDVTAQCFVHTSLTDRHTAERLDIGQISPGDIRLGDRAYARWDGLHAVVTAGADYLVRLAAKAALTLRTASLDAAETALEAGGIRGVDRIGTSVLVPAAAAFGVTVEFSV